MMQRGNWGVGKVRGLRAVLVTVPPLLAELIRYVLTTRADVRSVVDLTDHETVPEQLRELAPEIVIIGLANAGSAISAASVRMELPDSCVLTLSADLKLLFGPGDDDVAVFTPDTLASRLPQAG